MHAASTRELTRETLKNTDLVEGGHSVGVRMVCTPWAQHVHTENTRCSASLLRNQAESYCFLYVLAMYAASTRELTRETLKNAVLVEGSRSAGVRTECTECTECTVCTWSALGVHSPVRWCTRWVDGVHQQSLSRWIGLWQNRSGPGTIGYWLIFESFLHVVLFAHWSPIVDVPVGQFSAMNMHPNLNFEIWNNVYNNTYNWNNSEIMRIICINQHGLGYCGGHGRCLLDHRF